MFAGDRDKFGGSILGGTGSFYEEEVTAKLKQMRILRIIEKMSGNPFRDGRNRKQWIYQ